MRSLFWNAFFIFIGTQFKMARPSKYSQQIARTICKQISEGKSLREICKDERIPHRSTVMNWCKENRDFHDQYARARELGADWYEDKIIEAVDNINPQNANASNVKISTLFKLMALRNPKKYSEKQRIDHSSSDGSMSNSKNVIVTFKDPPKYKEDDE